MNKEKIINFIKNNYFNLLIIIIIIIMISTIIFNLFLYSKIDNKNIEKTITIEDNEEIEESIQVEIKGMVNKPGVYKCNTDDRVNDVINKAEGLKEGANTDLISLSKKVTDEMVIIIYSDEFINNYKENNKKIEYVYIEVDSCPDKINDACINTVSNNENINSNENDNENTNNNESINKQENTDNNVNATNNKISLNNSSISELMTLTGIGEAKAKAIIKYREENNGFKEIKEITNISGIGDSIFEKIKDSITL